MAVQIPLREGPLRRRVRHRRVQFRLLVGKAVEGFPVLTVA